MSSLLTEAEAMNVETLQQSAQSRSGVANSNHNNNGTHPHAITPGVQAEPEEQDCSQSQSDDDTITSQTKGKFLPTSYKIKWCRNQLEKGYCPYEVKCMFAHNQAELRTRFHNVEEGITTEDAVRKILKDRVLHYRKDQPSQHNQGEGGGNVGNTVVHPPGGGGGDIPQGYSSSHSTITTDTRYLNPSLPNGLSVPTGFKNGATAGRASSLQMPMTVRVGITPTAHQPQQGVAPTAQQQQHTMFAVVPHTQQQVPSQPSQQQLTQQVQPQQQQVPSLNTPALQQAASPHPSTTVLQQQQQQSFALQQQPMMMYCHPPPLESVQPHMQYVNSAPGQSHQPIQQQQQQQFLAPQHQQGGSLAPVFFNPTPTAVPGGSLLPHQQQQQMVAQFHNGHLLPQTSGPLVPPQHTGFPQPTPLPLHQQAIIGSPAASPVMGSFPKWQ